MVILILLQIKLDFELLCYSKWGDMMTDEFKNDILDMSKEFDEKEGRVTCEVSIHKNLISEFVTFVKDNVNLKYGNWIVYECETCRRYHGDEYCHAEIIEKNQRILTDECSNEFRKYILEHSLAFI